MRLTMLTRDKKSLLRAASLRTAWETAHGVNDRKQRRWVEAGILPLNYSRSIYIGHLLLGLYSTPQTGSQSTAPSKVILRLSWGFAGRLPLAACCRSRLSAAGRRPSLH